MTDNHETLAGSRAASQRHPHLVHLDRCASNPDAYPYTWRDTDSETCDCGLRELRPMMSAAPELLAALKQVEREMRAGFGSTNGETREQVRRAIVKAEGVS